MRGGTESKILEDKKHRDIVPMPEAENQLIYTEKSPKVLEISSNSYLWKQGLSEMAEIIGSVESLYFRLRFPKPLPGWSCSTTGCLSPKRS